MAKSSADSLSMSYMKGARKLERRKVHGVKEGAKNKRRCKVQGVRLSGVHYMTQLTQRLNNRMTRSE